MATSVPSSSSPAPEQQAAALTPTAVPAQQISLPKYANVGEMIKAATDLKKSADLLMVKKNYKEAVEKYGAALATIVQERGGPLGESIAISCFANQAQCLINTEQYENALKSMDIAISIPTANADLHMYSKLWHRRGICQEALGNLPQALYSCDRAIGILPTQSSFLEYREKLLEAIISKHGIVPIPDAPSAVTVEEVEAVMNHILSKGGQPEAIYEKINELCAKRGNIDTFTEGSTNIMWALCQAAIARAGAAAKGLTVKMKKVHNETGEEETFEQPIAADDIYPLLEMVVKCGAKAEQRFIKLGNKTPVQMLALAGAVKCVKLLLAHGGTVFTYDDNHWTPLLVACSPTGPCSGKNSAMVALLLEHKPLVNHQNITGVHALSLACQSGDVEAVNMLMARSCKINLRCKMGFSPMVWTKIACRHQPNAMKIVSLLLQTAEGVKEQIPQLIKELQEDIKCCDASGILSQLNAAATRLRSGKSLESPPPATASTVESESNPPAPPSEVTTAPLSEAEITAKCLEGLFKMLSIPLEFVEKDEHILLVDNKEQDPSVKFKCNNIYELIYVHMFALLPNLFHKRWRAPPKVDANGEAIVPHKATGVLKPVADPVVQELCSTAHPLEQCWLNVLLTAAMGPDPSSPPHLVDVIHGATANSSSADPALKFYQNRLYPVYRDIVEIPLVQKFSAVVPINSAMDYIVSTYSSVLVVDNSFYWTKLLQKFHAQYKASAEATFVATGVNYVNADGSRNTDLTQSISTKTADSKIAAMLLMHDYTAVDGAFGTSRAIGTELIKANNAASIMLYEVFYDYNTSTNKNNDYINTDQVYMSKVLAECGYTNTSFEFTSAPRKGITSVTAPEATGGAGETTAVAEGAPAVATEGASAPVSTSVAIKSIANTDNIHMISTPSWCYKKTALSVWTKNA